MILARLATYELGRFGCLSSAGPPLPQRPLSAQSGRHTEEGRAKEPEKRQGRQSQGRAEEGSQGRQESKTRRESADPTELASRRSRRPRIGRRTASEASSR